MNKPNLSRLLKGAQKTLSKHSPEILTGLGIAGMATTVVLAVRATPKALKLCEELRKDRIDEYDEEPTKFEYVKEAWKCYIPAAVTGVFSTACLIGANSVNARRNAAIATAYKLSEAALTEYQSKVVETIGEAKEQEVREKIAEDKIEKHPIAQAKVINTGNGNILYLEAISGRYFESDINVVDRALNELNRRMNVDMYVSLTEFYNELGLDPTSISDHIGWNFDDGHVTVNTYAKVAADGRPCKVIDYKVPPHHKYDQFM